MLRNKGQCRHFWANCLTLTSVKKTAVLLILALLLKAPVFAQTELQCAANIKAEQFANGETWTLDQPVVTSRIVDCNQIQVHNGDRFRVSAQGCVNTADGWKNYVDPRGTNSDRLYHGLIWIPGATLNALRVPIGVDLGRIAGSLNHVFTINDLKQPENIRIGYEAETDPNQYAKAGYSQALEKAGANDCRSTASITITIEHQAGAGNAERLDSFDVVASKLDDNDLMLAPAWNKNAAGAAAVIDPSDECNNFPYRNPFLTNHGIKSPCSTQPAIDVPWRPTNPLEKANFHNYACFFGPCVGRLHGHVNWTPATFQGVIYWGEHAPDDDLDMFLIPMDALEGGKESKIVTKGSDQIELCSTPPLEFPQICQSDPDLTLRAIALEMKYSETVEHFVTEPWGQLHRAITGKPRNQQERDTGERFINGSTAVVNGLLSLDCVHDCHVELHPVFSMAVRIAKTAGDNTPTLAGAEHDDLWMIMTRNWGGEGYCSQDNHFLDRNSFVFRLPPPQGFTPTRPPKIQKEGVDLKSNAQGLHWEDITPEGSREAVLRITLADPEIGSRVSGSIHVCWEDPCTVAHPGPSGLLQKAVTVKTRREKGPEEVMTHKTSDKQTNKRALPLVAPAQPEIDSNPVTPGTGPSHLFAMQLPNAASIPAKQQSNSEMKIAKKQSDMRTLMDFCSLFGKVHLDSAIGKLCSHHGELGVFGEGLRLQRVPVTLGGIGGRFSGELYNTLSLEGESSFTFPRISAEGFSNGSSNFISSSSARTALIMGGAALRTCGTFSWFLTLKGGVIFIGISDPKAPAPAGFTSKLESLRSSPWHGVFYSGGGGQFNIGNFAFRLEAGDLMYFDNGANHNLRVTFGPNLRF